MAERLPRYRPLGVGVASVPAVDYTTAARMQASGYTDMAAALNKMSSFVFEKAGEFTKEEAIKFRYDNPVTPEQMQAAMDGGRDLDEIIGDRFTIFGRASRATAAVQLKTQLEAQAKNKLAEINAAMSGGADIDIGSMKNDLNNMINGHSNLLAQIDPQSAYQYSAAVNTLASSTYRNALEREYKLRQAGFKDVAERQMELLPTLIYDLLRSDTGATVTLPDGRVVPEIEGKMAIAARSTYDAVVATNDPDYALEQSAKIRGIVEAAKINVLVDHALSGDFSGNIDRGDFGRYTALYVGLNSDQKRKVRAEVRSEEAKIYKSNQQQKKEIQDEQKNKVNALLVEAARHHPNTPEHTAVMSALSRFAAIGLVSPSEYKSANKGLSADKPKDDPIIIGEIQRDIDFGQIFSLESLQARMDAAGVTPGAQNKLRDDYRSMSKADRAEAKRIVSANAGVFANMQFLNADTLQRADRAFAKMQPEFQFENEKRSIAKQPLISMAEFAAKYVEGGIKDKKFDDIKKARLDISEELKSQNIENINVEALSSPEDVEKFINLFTSKEMNKNNKAIIIDLLKGLKNRLEQ